MSGTGNDFTKWEKGTNTHQSNHLCAFWQEAFQRAARRIGEGNIWNAPQAAAVKCADFADAATTIYRNRAYGGNK